MTIQFVIQLHTLRSDKEKKTRKKYNEPKRQTNLCPQQAVLCALYWKRAFRQPQLSSPLDNGICNHKDSSGQSIRLEP